MPVSMKYSPFAGDDNKPPTTAKRHVLRTPQARALSALVPEDTSWPVSEWPLLNRANLSVNAGYTAISGTMTRALNGIKEDSSSGDAHPGLLTLGYVEEVVLDVEGVKEVNYRATVVGAVAYLEWAAVNGGVPQVKDRAMCINDRYKKVSKELK